jgi:hypothetical protein
VRHRLDEFVVATHLYRPLRFLYYLQPSTWAERRRGASRGIVGLADEFSRPIDLSPIPPAAASPMGPSAPALPAPETVAPAISTDDPALPFEAPPSPPPPVAERAG